MFFTTWNAARPAGPGRSTPAPAITLPGVRHAAPRALRHGAGAGVVGARASPAASRRCGATARCCRSSRASRRSRSARASRRCCTPRGSATAVGLPHLFVKDESFNPTNSFKARGQSTAVTRARALGATTITLPTAGNAGNAAAAYAAAAGLRCEVFMPRDAKQPFLDECRLYGAQRHAGRRAHHRRRPAGGEQAKIHGWYDVSTLKEPYRVEGKKTMGYELAEQLDVDAARLDHLSDRRRHRHGRHVEGVRRDGGARLDRTASARRWSRCSRPAARRSSARSSDGAERATLWEHPDTEAHGLRVPRAIGDFLVLRAIRESGGTALAVTDQQMVDDMIAHRPARGHLGGAGRRGGAVGRPGAGRRRAHPAARDGGPLQHRRRARSTSKCCAPCG